MPDAVAVWSTESPRVEQEPTLEFSDAQGRRVYQPVELTDFAVPQGFSLICRAVGPTRLVLIEGQSIGQGRHK